MESWTIQCEVIQREMLGARPQDEDPIPEQIQIQGQLPFDFFGLGQNVMDQQGTQNQEQNQGVPNNNPQNDAAQQEGNGWPDWPEELPAAHQIPPMIEVNLNAPPPVLLQDLNDMPMIEDPLEVLIHPAAPNVNQNNWEMEPNDIHQGMQEVFIPQPAQPQPIEVEAEVAENAVEIGPIHLLDEENNFLPLEIQEEDLMNEDEIQEMEMNKTWIGNRIKLFLSITFSLG